MITKLFLMSAFVVGGVTVANAQDATPTTTTTATTTTSTTVALPTCSRTVTDKCINRTATKKVVVHNKKAVSRTSKVTTTTN